MTASYHILATVSLLHDYYEDGRCPDFSVRPTPDSLSALKGLGILTRQIGNMLVLLVRVTEDGKLFQELPRSLKLRFFLNLEQPRFMNYTHISFSQQSVYYFNNLYKNKSNGTLYLSRPLPAFSNATAYAIGDQVGAGGNIYEAIKPVAAGAAPVNNTDFWYQRPESQYVNPGDLLRLTDGRLEMEVAEGTSFNIKIFGLNPAGSDYDVLLREEEQRLPQPVKKITIALNDLWPAPYRMEVNGVSRSIYLDRNAVHDNVFGILELFHRFPPSDEFGWLGDTDVPTALDYVIRFPNRLVIWKYITRTTNVTAIENTAVPDQFVLVSPRQFVSVQPLPLRQLPLKTLQVKKDAAVLATRLANPSPDRISTYTDEDDNTWYCAVMHLNY